MARIFVCRDTAQADLIDGTAQALAAEGHHILRGPVDEVGTVRHYNQAERAACFATADAAIFTTRHACSADVLASAARLRGVCYPVTGVETLDLEAAAELGIIVGHGAVRGNVVGMAEATVMLMLMLFYDVRINMRLIDAGRWRRPGHHSHQIEGKTIGLIGFGRIAREVSARLAPFNTRILTASPRARQSELPANVTKTELDHLLAESDLVSVLTGLTPSTRHLLGARELGLMKPSAYLVNTGRGAVIDQQALIETLAARRIAGAALDTFTVEPLPADSTLRMLDNVVLTPHCVGHTVESAQEIGPALLENTRRILDGRMPLICKNPEVEPAWRERLRRLAANEPMSASVVS